VYTQKNTTFGEGATARLAFTSEEISDFLIRNGIGPDKSLTLCVSPLLANSPHFWRAAIDGDGTICISTDGQAKVYLYSASLDFIHQFCDFCEKNIGHCPRILKREAGEYFNKSPNYRATLDSGYARDLIKLLYTDPVEFLDRKKAIADRISTQIPGQRKLSAVPAVRTAI
jgi:hypothetical protein